VPHERLGAISYPHTRANPKGKIEAPGHRDIASMDQHYVVTTTGHLCHGRAGPDVVSSPLSDGTGT
jgi:hypothetical protein